MGKFAIIIRGHIRTAFINNTLHDLIKDLVNKHKYFMKHKKLLNPKTRNMILRIIN